VTIGDSETIYLWPTSKSLAEKDLIQGKHQRETSDLIDTAVAQAQ